MPVVDDNASASTGGVTVSVAETPDDLAGWVRLPRQIIYSPASPWVPPLDGDLLRALDRRKNPFFQHGEAVPLLACWPDGRPAGRVLAQIYHRHNERHGERASFFGYFECADDPAVARALIQAAARYGATWNCDTLRGPFNMTAMQEMGILVDGFERAPAVDQTYTAPYYPRLLEVAGLHAVFPHATYRVGDVRKVDLSGMLDERHRVLTAERRLKIRTGNLRNFDREIETLRTLLNDSFAENAHFVPLTAEDLTFQIGPYRSFLDPSLLLVAEMDGIARGFVLAVPDFNPLLKRLNGQIDGAYILHTLPNVGRWLWQRDACINIQGVERRLQGQGIMRVLLTRLMRNLRWRRYRGLSVTWIADENVAAAASVRAIGAQPLHRLTLYEGNIAALLDRAAPSPLP
jgi:GNAT superfamily N-acetyltransferase